MKTRQYNNGDTCSVSANPGSHYTFDGWFENDSIVSSDNPYSFTVSGDRTLEGKFTANSYTITTNSSPVSSGSISGGGTYDYGDTCTLTATENQDYRFATWTDGDGNFLSNDNPFSFTVSGDLTVRGVFSTGYNTYTITIISPHGSVSGDGVYALDDTCTLTSTPNPGYVFDHWEMNGVEISDNNPYSFTVDGDKTITAVYEVIPSALRITVNGPAVVRLINTNSNVYTWNLSNGLNEYRGTEPGFALNEITNVYAPSDIGGNNSKFISVDASELTSWTSVYSSFGFCTNLTSITLPNSITSIGSSAFNGCTSLTNLTLPSSLTTIGNNAFNGCTSLTLSPDGGLPTSLTTIGNFAFAYCTSLVEISIVDTNTTSIGEGAFSNCTGLEDLFLNNGRLQTIGTSAFYNCSSLGSGGIGSIDLPSTMTSIGAYAFKFVGPDILAFYCYATTPPTIGTETFNTLTLCPIYVPAASLSDYQTEWSEYTDRIFANPNS